MTILNALRSRLSPLAVAVAALVGVGGVAAYEKLAGGDCCYPGASCCHPGAACCAKHKVAQR